LKNSTSGHIEVNWFGAISTPFIARWGQKIAIDPSQFRSGRQFAAWLGLVPRQNSSGGKDRLGRISKMGDRYLRRLLVVGATALIRFARNRTNPLAEWAEKLLNRRPARLVSVALANKIARVAWALLVRGGYYGSQLAPAA
jgi:transposase